MTVKTGVFFSKEEIERIIDDLDYVDTRIEYHSNREKQKMDKLVFWLEDKLKLMRSEK